MLKIASERVTTLIFFFWGHSPRPQLGTDPLQVPRLRLQYSSPNLYFWIRPWNETVWMKRRHNTKMNGKPPVGYHTSILHYVLFYFQHTKFSMNVRRDRHEKYWQNHSTTTTTNAQNQIQNRSKMLQPTSCTTAEALWHANNSNVLWESNEVTKFTRHL